MEHQRSSEIDWKQVDAKILYIDHLVDDIEALFKSCEGAKLGWLTAIYCGKTLKAIEALRILLGLPSLETQ